jgi:hypothetical protein
LAFGRLIYAPIELCSVESRKMSDLQRGLRPNERALEQPNSQGHWWFSGIVHIETPVRRDGTSGFDIPIRTLRLFDLHQEGEKLIIAEARDHLIYPTNCQWIGWWTKQS